MASQTAASSDKKTEGKRAASTAGMMDERRAEKKAACWAALRAVMTVEKTDDTMAAK